MSSKLIVDVEIIEAVDVPAMDLNGFSDCYVTCKVAGIQKKTKTILKNLKPVWCEKFSFHFMNYEEDVILYLYGNSKKIIQYQTGIN
jgi:Ca2+-dependent lipid-binding protein